MTTLDDLAQKLSVVETRQIVAIAGPPGSGKSTFADALRDRINADNPGTCEVLPMDGYHYDDTYLTPMGWQSRKGAPHTFDVNGLRAMLGRLKTNQEPAIAVPVFDRDLEIARAGARMIKRDLKLILVEGNYLLLNRSPWDSLLPFFDMTVMLHVPLETIAQRLNNRWTGFGFSPNEAADKVAQNDLVNVHEVLDHSVNADHIIDNGG